MEITIFTNFFYFEVVYLAEKSIFLDETFFVASDCPSSTTLPTETKTAGD